MILTAGFARSAGVLILAGFAIGTITVRMFFAKFTGGPVVRPLSASFWGFVVSADRKTLAGAPCSILVSSAEDASVDMTRVTPGWEASYTGLAASSAPLSDAAP